jgi:hypothetical protein
MGANRSLTRRTLRSRTKSSEESRGVLHEGRNRASSKKSRYAVVDHDASAAPKKWGSARSLRPFSMPLFTLVRGI